MPVCVHVCVLVSRRSLKRSSPSLERESDKRERASGPGGDASPDSSFSVRRQRAGRVPHPRKAGPVYAYCSLLLSLAGFGQWAWGAVVECARLLPDAGRRACVSVGSGDLLTLATVPATHRSSQLCAVAAPPPPHIPPLVHAGTGGDAAGTLVAPMAALLVASGDAAPSPMASPLPLPLNNPLGSGAGVVGASALTGTGAVGGGGGGVALGVGGSAAAGLAPYASTVDLGSGSYHTSVMNSVRSNKSRHQTMVAVAAAGGSSGVGVPGGALRFGCCWWRPRACGSDVCCAPLPLWTCTGNLYEPGCNAFPRAPPPRS